MHAKQIYEKAALNMWRPGATRRVSIDRFIAVFIVFSSHARVQRETKAVVDFF